MKYCSNSIEERCDNSVPYGKIKLSISKEIVLTAEIKDKQKFELQYVTLNIEDLYDVDKVTYILKSMCNKLVTESEKIAHA